MSQKKKQIRAFFREAVFVRDNHKCKLCGKPAVDAHHITDRNLLPNGGYVVSNGISVCEKCHELVEEYHVYGEAQPGFTPNELYKLIGSSYDVAYQNSLKLE